MKVYSAKYDASQATEENSLTANLLKYPEIAKKILGKLKTEMDESEAKFQEASRVYNQKIDNLKKELSELAEASAARANGLESQLQALKIEDDPPLRRNAEYHRKRCGCLRYPDERSICRESTTGRQVPTEYFYCSGLRSISWYLLENNTIKEEAVIWQLGS